MQLFILLVLLVLLHHAAMATEVTGCLSDRDKDHRQRENCTAAGYSDVPPGLRPSTKVLLFPQNLFSRLSWASFQIFPELYEMDLTNNKVPEVTPSVSPILPSLSVLRLGSNRLSSLPDGSFSACPGLTELYLDNNTIDSLSDHTFSGLSRLEILDLSSNHIKVLPELMLHPLPAIETLFLENNKINAMPDDWFSQKEEVPYLYLSANPWACSCSLVYLRRYLDDYELNVYVRDGPLIKSDADSVVCDSPQLHKGQPVMSLEESHLCSGGPEPGSRGDFIQPIRRGKTTTASTTTASASTTTASASTTTASASTTTASASTTTASASTTTATASTTTTAPSSTGTPALLDLHTENHSGSTLVESYSTIKLSTERPAGITSAMPTNATTTTKSVPSTSTPKVPVVTTTIVIPSWATDDQRRGEIGAVDGAGMFCIWLFSGCLLLCVASAVCILATVVTLVMWYRREYKLLKMTLVRNRGGTEGERLLSRREEKEVVGGVVALYRSVLFIHRDGGEERGDVALEPARGGERREGDGGREERGVYSKTLYRVVSREEEIEGWRDVLEECRRDGGGKDEGMDAERRGGGSRKRYSVILREEREEAGGAREELDWVVGGWEVKRGGERVEPRSSWGEWLAHYLPSMPWGVTTPPEGEAVH